MASIPPCHGGDPGSIPGQGALRCLVSIVVSTVGCDPANPSSILGLGTTFLIITSFHITFPMLHHSPITFLHAQRDKSIHTHHLVPLPHYFVLALEFVSPFFLRRHHTCKRESLSHVASTQFDLLHPSTIRPLPTCVLASRRACLSCLLDVPEANLVFNQEHDKEKISFIPTKHHH